MAKTATNSKMNNDLENRVVKLETKQQIFETNMNNLTASINGLRQSMDHHTETERKSFIDYTKAFSDLKTEVEVNNAEIKHVKESLKTPNNPQKYFNRAIVGLCFLIVLGALVSMNWLDPEIIKVIFGK